MPRIRKRDWPIVVYKFAVTDATIPQSMWNVAKTMNSAWCQLAIVHRWLRETQPEDENEKKAHWELFDPLAKQIVDALGLNWECGPEVIDRFRTACTNARRNPKTGWPKPHAMDSICIPHRYTGGGSPLISLTSMRSKRFGLDVLSTGCNAGHFGIDNDRIAFRSVVHRVIPQCGIAKKVCWCGRKDVFGWRWHVTVTVELQQHERTNTGKSVGIDLGWRKQLDGIRVAVFADSDGRFAELVMPLDCSTRDSRRSNERTGHSSPLSWSELRELQSDLSQSVEDAKRDTRSMLENIPAGFDRMREGGLLKLLKDERAPVCVRNRLAVFAGRYQHLLRLYTRASQRIVGRRRWLYQNFAAWIAKNYDRVSIEGDLDIKAMIEESNKPHALNAADRYHQYAATGELKAEIIKACKKYGATIVRSDAAHSTATCCVCGSEVSTGPEIVLCCRNGHKIDQDVNASVNLLSQTEGGFVQNALLRVFETPGRWVMHDLARDY